jgi:hypothetical protein
VAVRSHPQGGYGGDRIPDLPFFRGPLSRLSYAAKCSGLATGSHRPPRRVRLRCPYYRSEPTEQGYPVTGPRYSASRRDTGNRTPAACPQSRRATTTQYPVNTGLCQLSYSPRFSQGGLPWPSRWPPGWHENPCESRRDSNPHLRLVGMGRFERPTSSPRTKRANQAVLHPDVLRGAEGPRTPGLCIASAALFRI